MKEYLTTDRFWCFDKDFLNNLTLLWNVCGYMQRCHMSRIMRDSPANLKFVPRHGSLLICPGFKLSTFFLIFKIHQSNQKLLMNLKIVRKCWFNFITLQFWVTLFVCYPKCTKTWYFSFILVKSILTLMLIVTLFIF